MTQSISGSKESTQAASELQSKPQRKSWLLMTVGLVAIAAVGTSIWYFLGRPVDSDLQVSGCIDGYETDIGAKTGGRIEAIAVREGDEVFQGQLLVKISDDEVQAQLRGAAAKVAAAQDQAKQAKLGIDVIESQIREAQLNLRQSNQDQQGRIYQAESNVATSTAQLKQAQAQLKLAEENLKRYRQLWQDGAGTRQLYDQAQATYDTALANVEAAQKQINAAQGGLTVAGTASYNPEIRSAQLSGLYKELQRAYAQYQAAQSDVKNAQAAQQQIEAQIAYLNITSPIHGVVTARSVEPGAVVASGKTVLTVIDLDSVYLRGFVPEGRIPDVRVGQKAKVFLDSDPKQPLSARVAAIDPKASFTPENVYFRDDRVKQVFGIKLTIDTPGGRAKPGMPADAAIILK